VKSQRIKPALRVRAKITSQNWRSDLVQIWLIQENKTTGIASYFEDFANEASTKYELKQRCKNVKLFFREPLGQHWPDGDHTLKPLLRKWHPPIVIFSWERLPAAIRFTTIAVGSRSHATTTFFRVFGHRWPEKAFYESGKC
jgi:hypothetical protein